MSKKYSKKIISRAKTLFLQNLSLGKIVKQLKSEYPKACQNLSRSNVDYWAIGWREDRKNLATKSISKAKKKVVPDLQKDLENYHAESYEMDANLRIESYHKLIQFVRNTNCDIFTVKIFADIFRISTANVVRLWEISKDNKDSGQLVYEILKLRGQINE